MRRGLFTRISYLEESVGKVVVVEDMLPEDIDAVWVPYHPWPVQDSSPAEPGGSVRGRQQWVGWDRQLSAEWGKEISPEENMELEKKNTFTVRHTKIYCRQCQLASSLFQCQTLETSVAICAWWLDPAGHVHVV